MRKVLKIYLMWSAAFLPLTLYGWFTEGNLTLSYLLRCLQNFVFVGDNFNSWTLWYLIVFFNEAEAVAAITDYDEEEQAKPRAKKVKGKRAQDIKGLPVIPVDHKMLEEELIAEFGEDGWYQLGDEIYNCYKFTPAIQAIYREEKKLCDMSEEERLEHRQLTVRPLVDAYFVWVKENEGRVPVKSKTHNGFSYSMNQEEYLKIFLKEGEVPMDNNSAEQSIRGLCIEKKNWMMIDTIAGAESSAIIYSIAEAAKANNLKPYDYFEYLQTEIPKHLDETNPSFCEELLPWSDKLPLNCRKQL